MAKKPSDLIDRLSLEDVIRFSSDVYQKKYEDSMLRLINILQFVHKDRFEILFGESDAIDQSKKLIAILTGGIDALLSDPDFHLNEVGFRSLISVKGAIRKIYDASALKNTSHFQVLLSDWTEEEATVATNNIPKLLLVATIDGVDEQVLRMIEGMQEDTQLLVWMSLLDNKTIFTEAAQLNLNRILAGIEKIRPTPFKNQIEVFMASRVWFYCSFWDNPDKHRVKQLINSAFVLTAKEQKFHPKVNLADYPMREERKIKMIIVLEAWRRDHVMYRSYSPTFKDLSKKFETIALGASSRVDEKALEMFDNVILHGPRNSFHDTRSLVKKIQKIAPDIMLFSSVGMCATAIQLSQLRLAPVQIMLAGHPASSFSDDIDYMLLEEGFLPAEHCVTEKIGVLGPGTSISFARPSQPPFKTLYQEKSSEKNKKFKIVCNSMAQKITPSFINVCKEIQGLVDKDLEFHFLIGADIFTQRGLQEIVETKLESVVVYSNMKYGDYSKIIAQADLQLTPFPFGNTNSFVDAMLVGVPTICLDGDEIFSVIDVAMSKKMGLPDICRAETKKAYVEAAKELIENDEKRQAIATHIRKADLDQILFFDISNIENNLSNVISKLYDGHQRFQKDPFRTVKLY